MVICGYHAVEESLRSGSRGSLLFSRAGERIDSLKELARAGGVSARFVSAKELTRICGHDRHQGVVLLSEPSKTPEKKNLQDALTTIGGSNPLVLMLDELNDPHNFGAILRSADQMAVNLVVTTIRRSVSETPAVIRASAGASRFVKVIPVANLVQAMEVCKRNHFWIYGADISGQNLQAQGFHGPVALVMGGEYRGLRRLVRERCDFLIRIPTRGQVDSLNVSVAAGILLYEIRRQQGFPGFP
ncbi:MAG: 23S rRNA (guanosine(2251)-2'-O)-methyltransferase RlmB [Spirochaetaceae bacterium]|nr:MAG: 23S rRNA (guanosine(2251)-2'-O)-methyltransferase RlmB [Spirochaetaceae bacterium]